MPSGIYKLHCNEKLSDITTLNIDSNVIEISIQSCRLKNIPKDFFMKFPSLETLNLQNNEIDELPNLPPNLTYLNMSYNRMTTFIIDCASNRLLDAIDIKYNYIAEYPVILNRPDGLLVYYKGNNREYDQENELDGRQQQARIMQNAKRGIPNNNIQKSLEATNVHEFQDSIKYS